PGTPDAHSHPRLFRQAWLSVRTRPGVHLTLPLCTYAGIETDRSVPEATAPGDLRYPRPVPALPARIRVSLQVPNRSNPSKRARRLQTILRGTARGCESRRPPRGRKTRKTRSQSPWDSRTAEKAIIRNPSVYGVEPSGRKLKLELGANPCA